MAEINKINFDSVINDALMAAKAALDNDQNWDAIRDIVENIGKSITGDIEFIAKKKASGEFNEADARVYLDDQRMLARIRLRSLAIITLQIAERIWNAIADVFRKAASTALGWVIL